MRWSTIVTAENQSIKGVPTDSPDVARDLSPAEKAALLSKGVWLIYRQITKIAGVIRQTDKVKT